MCSGRVQDYASATVTCVLCVKVLGMAFWHDSVSSRRNNQDDPWGWNPKNNALAFFRVFKR
eukprot:3609451-Pyramimonas_sp.AAC.1